MDMLWLILAVLVYVSTIKWLKRSNMPHTMAKPKETQAQKRRRVEYNNKWDAYMKQQAKERAEAQQPFASAVPLPYTMQGTGMKDTDGVDVIEFENTQPEAR